MAEWDLFAAVGGGQTVYRGLITASPEAEFYYLQAQEPAEAARPANARPIPAPDLPPSTIDFGAQHAFAHPYLEAERVAEAVARAAPPGGFDVVDVPDYRELGLFLRQALERRGVRVGRLVLALHGTISSALRGGWPWEGDARRLFAGIELRERLQRQAVDGLYAISDAYADEIERRSGRRIARLDPLSFLPPPAPAGVAVGDGAPDLVFLGRKEKRKGPDLLLDLAWALPRSAYGRLRLIGGEGRNHQGRDGGEILRTAAALRGLDFEDAPAIGPQAIEAIFRSRAVVLAPSRYDQFNLVALEALLQGCPTVIAPTAGVARFVRERIPSLQDWIVPFTSARPAAPWLQSVLAGYDHARQTVAAAVEDAQLVGAPLALARVYADLDAPSPRAAAFLRGLGETFAVRGRVSLGGPRPPLPQDRGLAVSLVAAGAALKAGAALTRLRQGPGARLSAAWGALRRPRPPLEALLQARIRRTYRLEGRAGAEFGMAGSLPGVRRHLAGHPETRGDDRARKIRYLNQLVDERRVERAHWFTELARLERLEDQPLLAATYEARLLRWLGAEAAPLRHPVARELAALGYAQEAAAVVAMAEAGDDPAGAPRALLDQAFAAHRQVPTPGALARVERLGEATDPKVSVVVSLYDAADKLPMFLRFLRQQTLIRDGHAEVVLVDSGSPAAEFAALEQVWREDPFPAVYARSARRETIQAAWNRGLALARGEHLAFLGVDEGLRPDGLEQLHAVLARRPEIDWVMADSFITEVDRKGAFDRDVMPYDRAGFAPWLHYLDSSYISYVGGLYRRSVHDRFGLYDPSFRAAGDTEFKNRVLPHLQVAHLAQPLGVFHNYPDARMTQHPRAELEDLRAWYLHRTAGGMAYAFDRTGLDAPMALLRASLGYRKAYKREMSTDIDLAAALALYIAARPDAPDGFAAVRQDALALRNRLRALEARRTRYEGVGAQYQLASDIFAARQLAARLAERLGSGPPALEVFNDNRYEQHFWSWSVPRSRRQASPS
ncbi:glycosyltransferase [Phenylobacterium sp.]|uniref:glycosyltransferase n=1 Tax=Phenylobacterium sp. TaxID=1871053 RepID=UPI0035B1CC6F